MRSSHASYARSAAALSDAQVEIAVSHADVLGPGWEPLEEAQQLLPSPQVMQPLTRDAATKPRPDGLLPGRARITVPLRTNSRRFTGESVPAESE